LRPFARRRLRTFLPALVELRLRNPCSRLRRTLLGWYVRFTTTASLEERKARQETMRDQSSQGTLDPASIQGVWRSRLILFPTVC
jgi:hypothetical protein